VKRDSILEIIPAIDLKEGRCVRLVQGQMDQETLYFEDPLEAARMWASRNAPRIHVVDLDGAVTGSPRNLPAIERIVRAVHVPVQVGGGIRTQEDIIRYLEIGVDRVILGTLACQDPDYVKRLAETYPEKILLGIDAKEGYVAIKGWQDVTQARAVDLVQAYPNIPVAGIVYTDIQRDGMLVGPNLPATEEVCHVSPFPVIASGGITSPEDLAALSRLAPLGLSGAIVGKALYSGRLNYREALDAVRPAEENR
jgi:phosphoribosylformimino-5-aminoimidazole carboxamide ribotide isomerase